MLADELELTTVGIDIGSATSHLAFSKVGLQRQTEHLSSKFVVVSREVLSASKVRLTPFCADGLIDLEALRSFLDESYQMAGLKPSSIDTGAVILTGRALERSNSRAVAEMFAEFAGDFVCVEAGHLLEAELAAYGSGAVELSRVTRETTLNIDIGGGTTKVTCLRSGQIISTSAFAVGGRLIAWNEDDVVERLEWPIEDVVAPIGLELTLGQRIRDVDKDVISAELATRLGEAIRSAASIAVPTGVNQAASKPNLWLTDPPIGMSIPTRILFSGGVAEYIYSPDADSFGDLSPLLARYVRKMVHELLPDAIIDEPLERIRATVIGASQFSTQVSGTTVFVSDGSALPIRNQPVIRIPDSFISEDMNPVRLTLQIAEVIERRLSIEHGPLLGLSCSWQGFPTYSRLLSMARGLLGALERTGHSGLILLCDVDVARTLGRILKDDLHFEGLIVTLDGLEVGAFDYVDIGQPFSDQSVVPVTVKSLLFS